MKAVPLNGFFHKMLLFWARSSTVEQGTHNPLVVGSNPAGPTTDNPNLKHFNLQLSSCHAKSGAFCVRE